MRFLSDVDEVLADFVGPACKVIERVLGRPWSLDEAPADSWDMFAGLEEAEQEVVFTILNAPGWCANLKPLPGARAFIERLQELLDDEVYACTSHNHSTHWVYEREIWLAKEMSIGPLHVVNTRAKYVCSGDFFLDDRPSHVTRWRSEYPSGVGMLWTTDHNRRLQGFDDLRVHSFDEVLGRVEDQIK